ncbi:plasminogen-binding N-terminal domain-containing protein [bacterium]|nr:plasminogen-binding N-terminal domain-containing protein [bacterium]MBU1958905.1 plasminogen-binding N-terminal domain-containing protein [bacterium]
MKKLLLLLLLLTTYILMANNLPQTIETTVSNVNDNGEIQLATSVPKGMSGIVIHDYGNGLSAITHSIISQGGSTIKVFPYTAIQHENIPTIQTAAKVNDKVILGNFYNNALLIAPNARTYAKITKSLKKTWIHPDTYALAFMREGESAITLESLKKFSMENQVGLVLIVTKDSLLILDPISKVFLAKHPLAGNAEKAMTPFFARFDQMDVSIFGLSKVTHTEYYQAVEGIK